MNLETVTAAIRPRNPWEAIDIGFLLARRWYWKLWLLWLLTALPALALLSGVGIVLPGSAPKWALFLFWFFKPIYEPALLLWISRALFGSCDGTRKTLEKMREKLSARSLRSTVLYRFSPFRSFSLPVLLLEGLEGKDRGDRLALLKDGYEISALLTMVGFCIEVFLALSLMGILYWFVPEELRWVDLGEFIFRPDNWLLLAGYFIACSIFAPLYVSAGFMMYISRRVELEAWDIEIGFRRMRQRLLKRKNGFAQTAATVVLLLVLWISCCPGKGWCLPKDPDAALDTVTTVLEQKEFGEKVTKYRWVAKDKDDQESDSIWARLWKEFFEALGRYIDKLSPLIARYGEFILWCGAGILICFLLLKYSHLRVWLADTFASPDAAASPPDIMFGMDLRPESLPDDIVETCSRLLAAGEKREAMSLLYRGTLSRLINGYSLKIHSSFTEDECCQEVQRSMPQPEATFFENLTSLWIFIAYGHRDPDTGACHALIDQWKILYGAQS